MKTVDKSLSKWMLPVRIYLEDLERIDAILSELGTPKYETKDYEYESLAELRENTRTNRIPELTAKVHGSSFTRSVTITLDRGSAWLRSSSSDKDCAGVFYHIQRILAERRRTAAWAFSGYFSAFLLVVMSATLLGSLWIRSPWRVVLQSLTWAGAIWSTWVTFIRMRHFSIVRLTYRGTERSFFERNKDNLILAILSAVTGALLGVGGTLLVSYLQKK